MLTTQNNGYLLKTKIRRKLDRKLTEIRFFTTKIVENYTKLTKIYLERRIERIKPIQIKNNKTRRNQRTYT